MSEALRGVPAVHGLLEEPAIAAFEPELGRETVKRAIGLVLDRARASGGSAGRAELVAEVAAQLASTARRGLLPAVNATGILLHTNLGRAPLAPEAIAAVARAARSYSNLEYDLDAGERGSRYARASDAICEATGAQAALVVNNCAAAVLLVLDTFAKGREAVVARSQLVEIGGGFRIPDVLERSGATLVEVGTTNRVYIEDYARALSPRSALLLRTHPSNYRIEGFTSEPSPAELVALGRRAGVPVVEDLGSGALVDLAQYGAAHERTVQEALADGIGLVTFSGDKLLGGPQCGIVVGRATLVARLASNPLMRALRVDKMTLAALVATLALYRDPAARNRIPLYRMLSATVEALRERGRRYAAELAGAQVVDTRAYAGGGTLPQSHVASIGIALETAAPDALASRLRAGTPPVVARVEDGRLVLDLRTIAPDEDDTVIAAVAAAVRA